MSMSELQKEIAESLRARNSISATNEPYQNFKLNLLALPIALAFAFVAKELWPLQVLAYFSSIIPLHELGHAVTAWLGGRFAFPAGAIVPTAAITLIGLERSLVVTILFVLAQLGFIYFAWKEKLHYWIAVSLACLVGVFYFTFRIPEETLSSWVSFGGIAGEFILGTVLVVGFYNRHFKLIRWDFFRYPLLVMGMTAFWNALSMWYRIQSKLESLPFGTAISSDGSADSSGDMNRLIAAGWTESQIIQSYLAIGKFCLGLILIQYIYSVWTGWEKSREQN